MKVLIADDDRITRLALRKKIQKWGYEDGQEAWEALSGIDPPRIAILDWMMPKMEGIEICQRLQKSETAPFIYTILLTVRSDKEDISKALDTGAYDFLSKPVHTPELRSRIAVGVRLVKAEEKLRESNKKITDSIRYAEMIQRSLLPNREEVNACLPENFIIWEPRDIVGGDIFFIERLKEGIIVAVADCTGHGVPGAFLTMIVSSGLRRIIKDDDCRDPVSILKRLNVIVKTTLRQDTDHAVSDDGLDAGVCYIGDPASGKRELTFAGAGLQLLYFDDDEIFVIKGDRQRIGYKRSNVDHNFTGHTIEIRHGMQFYLYTDGIVDQLGDNGRIGFGSKRFRNLLKQNAHLPFEKQRELVLSAFNQFKGEHERLDDVTVIGFGL